MSDKDAKKFNEVVDLTKQQRLDFSFVKERIPQLIEARKSAYGETIEKIWEDADKDYVPHRLKSRGKKIVATDEDRGWRGQMVNLGSSDWQSDVSKSNVFVKIQTALSILIDQNPTGVFTPASKKYQATNELIRQLYQRSWEVAKSNQQLKLFVFNLAKYGWACARTYPLRISRKVKNIVSYDAENPENSVWEEKEVVEYNDIFRENLNPWNVWIDDMAKPNNRFSIRDWTYRKVYSYDAAKEEFGKYKNWQYVEKNAGTTTQRLDQSSEKDKKYREQNLLEVFFYENRLRDLFCVKIGDIPVILEPLPISDYKGVKKLSLWQSYWNLRDDECPFGIGIYEAIKYDQGILDRFRNMTIDQLTLSIYKMWFYQGTQNLTDTGEIKLSPGVGKQVLSPKDINWVDVPGPGVEAFQGIQLFQSDVDEASGITDPLIGEVTGKTAFELAQAKESALKRLKSPLDNITDALNTEAYITVALCQLIYSVPEIYKISNPRLIDEYLRETKSDPSLFDRAPTGEFDELGNPIEDFNAKVFPEFPLNLESDEKGNLIETKETKFFRITPGGLNWEGVISVKSQSVLSPSKQVDKALELEMWNMLIPLFVQPPELYVKSAKSICKLYDKDPNDVLPDMWLQSTVPPEQQSLIVPQQPQISPDGQPMGGQMAQTPPTQAPTLTSRPQQPQRPTGLVGKIMSRIAGR